MKFLESNAQLYRFALVFFATLSLIAFNPYLIGDQRGDHFTYIRFAQDALTTHRYPPHFLYALILNILTLFSGHLKSLCFVAVLLLTTAVLFKVALSKLLIKNLTINHNQDIPTTNSILILTALFFVSPIVNWWQFPLILRGQFSPNIWHSPSAILLIPISLAIVTFLFRDDKTKTLIITSILLTISVFVKPNFVMAFCPAIIIFSILKKYPWKQIALLISPSLICLAWQYLQTFTPGGQHVAEHFRSSIQFAPFKVWFTFTKIPIGSLIVSFAFPVAFTSFFLSKVKNKDFFFFSWLLVGVSLLEFFLFAETGSKTVHGNFFWGTIPSLYILFLVSIVELWMIKREYYPNHEDKQFKICKILLLLHILSGILFFFRSAMGLDFYA